MRTIKFKVNQQRIKNLDSICHIYQGTDNYLNLEFIFNDDWDGCKKAISFIRSDKPELVLLLQNDSCTVPKEAFDGLTLQFYLVGKKLPNYRIETQKFNIKLGG